MAEIEMDQQDARPSLPYRSEAEQDNWGAAMEMEHGRRGESRQDQRAIPAEFKGTPAGEMMKWSRSPSARQRQRKMLMKQQELQEQMQRIDGRIVGPLAPATVMNFNPIAMRLAGMLYDKMVPQSGYSEDVFIRIPFNGRKHQAHYVTFASAHFWTATTGVQTDSVMGLDTPGVEARYIPPIGLAHQFYEHYVEGAQDAQHMGGVLVFEGDKRTFSQAIDRLLASERAIIYKPVARPLMDGMGGVVYRTQEVDLREELDRLFELQSNYANERISEAHAWHSTNNIVQQNMISPEHRIWAQWAVKMGYLDKLPPWATQRLSRTAIVEVIACKACGQIKPEGGEAFVCANCNMPYDVFQAFMAGVNVADQYLEMLKGAELDQVLQVLEERKKRASRIAQARRSAPQSDLFNTAVEEEEDGRPAPKGKGKGKGSK